MVRFDASRASALFYALHRNYASQREAAEADAGVFTEVREHYEQQICALENRIIELQSADAILSALAKIEKLICTVKPPSTGTTTKEQHHE